MPHFRSLCGTPQVRLDNVRLERPRPDDPFPRHRLQHKRYHLVSRILIFPLQLRELGQILTISSALPLFIPIVIPFPIVSPFSCSSTPTLSPSPGTGTYSSTFNSASVCSSCGSCATKNGYRVAPCRMGGSRPRISWTCMSSILGMANIR